MPRMPNFLIFMVDQLAGTMFADGPAAFLHVPVLRRLSDEVVNFSNAYCPSPLCAPARAGFMSGQLPSRTGVYDNAAEFASGIPTFAHDLIREALKMTGIVSGVELTTAADLPAGIGLGSSSSLTVGVLHALYALKGEWHAADDLARRACQIEIERLGWSAARVLRWMPR